jgi:hypothetical protein
VVAYTTFFSVWASFFESFRIFIVLRDFSTVLSIFTILLGRVFSVEL